MKHWFLFILVISWFCFPLSGQQTNRPDWVKQHPVSGLSYIGIGMDDSFLQLSLFPGDGNLKISFGADSAY